MSTGLHVFLLARPPTDVDLRGRSRIAAQSTLARRALALSATATGAVLGTLEKDSEDAPLPCDGWHWSLSHSTGFAAGAVCRAPIGIDVEAIRPRRADVVGRVTSRAELELLGGFSWHTFVRVWTAKEAVLKKAGVGLLELAQCRLVAAPDENRLIVHHRGRDHVVRQRAHAEHVAAVTHDGAELGLAWSWSADEVRAVVAATRSSGGPV